MKNAFLLFVTVALVLSLCSIVRADYYTNYLALVRARQMEEERLQDKKREQAKVESEIAYQSALTALIQAQTKALNEKIPRVNESAIPLNSNKTQTTNLESAPAINPYANNEYTRPIEDGQTYWRRVILEKFKVIAPPTANVSDLLRVYGELVAARQNKSKFNLPDGWHIDDTKPLEDGPTYWRRALLEKHKVMAPSAASLLELMKVYSDLNEASKIGVDYKLPVGWSRAANK